VIRIENLPNNIDLGMLKNQIKNQSKSVIPGVETINIIPESAALHPTFTGFVRMATIDTALGAKLRLKSLSYYKDCGFVFILGIMLSIILELSKWKLLTFASQIRSLRGQPG
jgi:hypothetical protein